MPTPAFQLDDDSRADCLKLLELALKEDTGASNLADAIDCTTFSVIPTAATATANFVSRQAGTICGVEITKLAIQTFAPSLEIQCSVEDGAAVNPGDTIATLSGSAHSILILERTCLNFMCRLSAISTLTNQFAQRIEGTNARILDTRKTTPGYRRLEKYAVACGGGSNHRMGLYDAVMIKDNHLAFYQAWNQESKNAVAEGIQRARHWIEQHQESLPNGKNTILQIEVDTLGQFETALDHGPDMILLDNMDNEQLRQAVQRRNQIAPKILLEASGGVTLETVAGIAQTGVDRISIGAMTHSATNFDIGLDWTIGPVN